MPEKVLIVDDEVLRHLLYRSHLERAGYQILTAKDGNEALEIATRERPQVVVMDVFMRGMDGLAALRAMKKNEVTRNTPVIIITAQVGAHHAARKESEAAGAALFLPKPFSPAQLLAALQQVTSASAPPKPNPDGPPPS
jgi:CheY-like chemotaxis protein